MIVREEVRYGRNAQRIYIGIIRYPSAPLRIVHDKLDAPLKVPMGKANVSRRADRKKRAGRLTA
jgi:hypothetical protein